MQREQAVKKLAAIKNLAEQGVGGEKETALQMYEKLKEKYGIAESEVTATAAQKEEQKKSGQLEFILWTVAQNLGEEQRLCQQCKESLNGKEECWHCSTLQNIKQLEKQFEELKQKAERGE